MKRMEKCVKIEYLLQGLMRGILCAIATWTFAQQVEKCVTKLRKSPFCCGKMRKMSTYFRTLLQFVAVDCNEKSKE